MANALTLARMLLALPFLALVFAPAPWGLAAGLAVFLVAATTDFLDGWVARARGETSMLGAALDPIADKVLVTAGFMALAAKGLLPGWSLAPAIAILLREVVVAGLREAVAAHGGALPVAPLAKVKTALQLSAIAALLAAAPAGPFGEGLAPVANGLLWAAGGLTLWTGAAYVFAGVRLLRARSPK